MCVFDKCLKIIIVKQLMFKVLCVFILSIYQNGMCKVNKIRI